MEPLNEEYEGDEAEAAYNSEDDGLNMKVRSSETPGTVSLH